MATSDSCTITPHVVMKQMGRNGTHLIVTPQALAEIVIGRKVLQLEHGRLLAVGRAVVLEELVLRHVDRVPCGALDHLPQITEPSPLKAQHTPPSRSHHAQFSQAAITAVKLASLSPPL